MKLKKNYSKQNIYIYIYIYIYICYSFIGLNLVWLHHLQKMGIN